MLSALKKLAKGGDDRCPAPTPMSSSLQKKFSKGVHYNMKILIKGDRNVGKSCLLQRLQGGPFIEEYVPTDQIQVAPIHWAYKNTDHIVKVEVWEVVDKGRQKKKATLGLKLENQSAPNQDDGTDTPVLDASFLDVYKNASGVILVFDITKTWTFEYVVKELGKVPADLPVVVLGNHMDMQHHRQVHPHHIHQAMHQAKLTRTAPVRYAESSMRNGFGLRLLHRFLSVPFLRLQRTSLLEQLQRNQKDSEEIERELDEFQNSEDSQYNSFVDRLANKRRENSVPSPRLPTDRSPSIVLGAGRPIVPPNVNPLVAQSLNPLGIKAQYTPEVTQNTQTQYVSPELLRPKQQAVLEAKPKKLQTQEGIPAPNNNAPTPGSGDLDDFYAGALDTSFLDDSAPVSNNNVSLDYDTESDDGNMNPLVLNDEEELDSLRTVNRLELKTKPKSTLNQDDDINLTNLSLNKDYVNPDPNAYEDNVEVGYPLWTRDSSARRSPEGGEDPDVAPEPFEKKEKKHKKKKTKDKDDGTEKKERKHKKKSKNDKKEPHTQHNLLTPTQTNDIEYLDYDSI